MRWPSKKRWCRICQVLTKREKIAFFSFLSLFLISLISLPAIFYFQNTEVRPAVAGKHTEAVIGLPRFINPIYAPSNDVDRDLIELIFSGLMQYGNNGEIVPDLAKEIKIQEDGQVYEIDLREGVLWHDGKPLTADDVIFTIKTIQNADYKSPLRGNYLGIDIEKIDKNSLRFKLKNGYGGFLERLTFKILPQHIWQNISPQNFLLTNYNLKPVGSGPYQLKNLKQDNAGAIASLDLVRFKDYYSDSEPQKPYLSEISFRFFQTEKDLYAFVKNGKADGFTLSSRDYQKNINENSFRKLSLSLPRYFAIFFNPDQSRFLADKNIRKALNYGLNKNEIIENENAVDSPLLPKIYGYQSPTLTYDFDLQKAENLLKEAGLEKKDGKWFKINKEQLVEFKSELKLGSQGKEVTALQTCLARYPEIYPDGKITGYFGSQTKAAIIKFQEKYIKESTGTVGKITRSKLNEICLQPSDQVPLKFSLITVEDPILEKMASRIKEQWEKLGIEIKIQIMPISQLEKDVIKPRSYEMILFGEVLGAIPDPFPFWHSSQKKDPGLNLAKYENKKVDQLLEKARTTLDAEVRTKNLEDFQNVLLEDAPALFLYSQDYLYFLSNKTNGMEAKMIVDPSKRFANIKDWYVKTKRTWK